MCLLFDLNTDVVRVDVLFVIGGVVVTITGDDVCGAARLLLPWCLVLMS